MKEGIKVTARFVVTAKLSENKVAVLDLKTFEERYYPVKKLYRSTRISSPKDVLWLVSKDAEKESVCSSRALFNAICDYHSDKVGKIARRAILAGEAVLLVIRAENGNVYGVSKDEVFDCLHKGNFSEDDKRDSQKSPFLLSMRVSAKGVVTIPTFVKNTIFDMVLSQCDTSENLPYMLFFLDLCESGEFSRITSYDPAWWGHLLTIQSALCLLTEMRPLMEEVIGGYDSSIPTVVVDLNFASSIRMSHKINWKRAFSRLSMNKVSFTSRSRCDAQTLYAMFEDCRDLQEVNLGYVDATGYVEPDCIASTSVDYSVKHPVYEMFNLTPSLRDVKLGHILISSWDDLAEMFNSREAGVPYVTWTPKVMGGISEDAIEQWLREYRKEGI